MSFYLLQKSVSVVQNNNNNIRIRYQYIMIGRTNMWAVGWSFSSLFFFVMIGWLDGSKRFHLCMIIFGYRNNFSDAKRDWRLFGAN